MLIRKIERLPRFGGLSVIIEKLGCAFFYTRLILLGTKVEEEEMVYRTRTKRKATYCIIDLMQKKSNKVIAPRYSFFINYKIHKRLEN